MTTAVIVLSLLVAVFVALAAGLNFALQHTRAELEASGYRRLLGRRVTASVADGGSIRGVLTHVYEDAIVLAHPEFVAGSRPAGIGSEVTLARASVPMLQCFDEEA